VGVSEIEVNIYGEITAMHQDRSLKVLVDTVVYAGSYERCDGAFADLEGKVPEVHFIGDAWETAELTRMIYEATGTLVEMAERLRGPAK
jgi:hypothetical protein